jgi:hypothetical protein
MSIGQLLRGLCRLLGVALAALLLTQAPEAENLWWSFYMNFVAISALGFFGMFQIGMMENDND